MHRLGLPLVVAAAFAVRAALMWDRVFTEPVVRLIGADPWHHARQIRQLVRHFPERMVFDPYALHPDGQAVPVAPFFDFVVAFVAWVIGSGSPSPATVDAVIAIAPPVLGALVCVPVWFLAKRMAGTTAAFVAAVTVAALPTPLLVRSRLGFPDHHVLESLLVVVTVLLMHHVCELVREQPLTFADIRRGGWGREPWLWHGFLTGLALGAYLQTWFGGPVFVLMLAAWGFVQVHLDHARGRRADGVAFAGAPMLVGAMLVLLLFQEFGGRHWQGQAALLFTFLLFVALVSVSNLLLGRIRRWMFPIATITVAAVAMVVGYRLLPDTFEAAIGGVGWFSAEGLQMTVAEARPLFAAVEGGPSRTAWVQYGIGLVTVPVGIAYLGWRVLRHGRAADTLVLLWSVGMVLLTLGQTRFGYYAAVNVGILTGILAAPVLSWALGDEPEPGWKGMARRALLVSAVVVLVVGPVLPTTWVTMRMHATPHSDWIDTMVWMRDNTAEPFGDPERYHAIVSEEEAAERPAEHGVMCWWDAGYWVTSIARRIPVANPTQAGAGKASRYLLAQNEGTGNRILDETGCRYVIVDSSLPFWQPVDGPAEGRLTELAPWAGLERSEFQETYWMRRDDGHFEPVTLFYPAYYRTMCLRLYVFDMEAYTPPEGAITVVAWEETTDADGTERKIIRSLQQAATTAQAEDLVAAAGKNARIVGLDPFMSCVPLEALTSYRVVYRSPNVVFTRGAAETRYVQIYEYTGAE